MTENDNGSTTDETPTDGGSTVDEPADEPERVSYDDVSFTDQAGFKPMLGIAAAVLISFFLLVGLPFYSEPGDGELTLFSYTAVLWGVVIILCGFAYEYWLMKVEGDGW